MKRIGLVLVACLMAFGLLCGCDAGQMAEGTSSEWSYITVSSTADKTTATAKTTTSVSTTTSTEAEIDTTTTSAVTSITEAVTTTVSTTKKPIVTTTTTTVRRTTSTTRRTTTTTTVRTTVRAEPQGDMVWIPNSGKKYHCRSSCSGMKNPSYVTRQEAIRLGYEPCKRCY